MLWLVLLGYGVALMLLSPRSGDARGFCWGHDDRGREAGLWLLSGSILITWIFAKSVTNAANLGATFGIVGGLAYAAYYLSIPVAGFTIASIRKRHGVKSLAEFLIRTYGRGVPPGPCPQAWLSGQGRMPRYWGSMSTACWCVLGCTYYPWG